MDLRANREVRKCGVGGGVGREGRRKVEKGIADLERAVGGLEKWVGESKRKEGPEVKHERVKYGRGAGG